MASWLGSLASNVESLLDRVDQVANETFVKDAETQPVYFDAEGNVLPPESQLLQAPAANPVNSSYLQKASASGLPYTSVQMDHDSQKAWLSRPQKSVAESMTPVISGTRSRSLASSKDPDQELFEFLNNADVPDPKSDSVAIRFESRSPSASSSISARSRKTPEGSSTESAVNLSLIRVPEIPRTSSSADDLEKSADDENLHQNRDFTELEQENQLLKSEITSLNHELHLHAQRLQASQQELVRVQRQLEAARSHQTAGDQAAAELRRREADCREALAAKDAQIAVLRTRLEEADVQLDARKRQLNELQAAGDRSHNEPVSGSVVPRHLMDALQEKLNDVEAALRREKEERHRENEEAIRCRSRLETEKQNLTEEIGSLQKSLNKEKARNSEFTALLKGAHSQAEAAKQELSDYRDKATRILQGKEKLIASLKENLTAGRGSDGSETVLLSELDALKQEKDALRDQLQNAHIALDSLRRELAELETQTQSESESVREQATAFEEQLRAEKRRREDAEFDVSKLKQEMRTMHDELVKQKTAFQSRLQGRDDEIDRLRGQLTTKSFNVLNQEELENRLRALTESLIQKQTLLESLSTEKNSMALQLERMERHCREAESSALRAAATNVNVSDEDEVRQRLPAFMKQSPLDGNVTRRVKMAAGVVENLGVCSTSG